MLPTTNCLSIPRRDTFSFQSLHFYIHERVQVTLRKLGYDYNSCLGGLAEACGHFSRLIRLVLPPNTPCSPRADRSLSFWQSCLSQLPVTPRPTYSFEPQGKPVRYEFFVGFGIVASDQTGSSPRSARAFLFLPLVLWGGDLTLAVSFRDPVTHCRINQQPAHAWSRAP